MTAACVCLCDKGRETHSFGSMPTYPHPSTHHTHTEPGYLITQKHLTYWQRHNIYHMANMQTQAYLICYFHVNAILSPITMATQMTDSTEKVGVVRKKKRNEVLRCIFLTPPPHKHTLVHKDKNATTAVMNPKKCELQGGYLAI